VGDEQQLAQIQHSAQKSENEAQLETFLPAWSAYVSQALQKQLLVDQPFERPFLPQPQDAAQGAIDSQWLPLKDEESVAGVQDFLLADLADELVQKGQDEASDCYVSAIEEDGHKFKTDIFKVILVDVSILLIFVLSLPGDRHGSIKQPHHLEQIHQLIVLLPLCLALILRQLVQLLQEVEQTVLFTPEGDVKCGGSQSQLVFLRHHPLEYFLVQVDSSETVDHVGDGGKDVDAFLEVSCLIQLLA
jgi:hypothetical protein